MPLSDPTPLFAEAGGALNVDPTLLQAIAQVESGGAKDPDRAVSSAGALGRMQVMPQNLQRYNVSDPSDPRQNIHAGAAVFDEALTAANGNVPLALRIYQGGQDRTKWGPQNAAYPGKVAAAYQTLAQQRQGAPNASAGATPADPTDAFLAGGQAPESSAGATGKPTAPDPTDVFLAGKEAPQAAPAAPAATPATRPATEQEFEDEQGAVGRVIGAARKGAVEGFGNPLGQSILSPLAQSYLDDKQRQGGIPGRLAQLGSTVGTDIGTGLGIAGGAVNALFRGAQGAVAQTGEEVGAPQAGRDIAAIPEAFMGGGPQGFARLPVNALQAAALRRGAAGEAAGVAAPGMGQAPADSVAAPLNPNVAVNRLAAEATSDAGPQSVGAAASRDMSHPSVIDMTPAEMKANRRQAEKADLLAPPEPGDTTIHVDGSLPTRAEFSGDPTVSQQEIMLRQRAPNAFEGNGGRLTDNTAARVNAYDNMTPSDTTLQRWESERTAQAETDNAAIMAHAKLADLTPALEVYDSVLNDPRSQERDAVMNVLGPLRDKLFDADGNLKTDPQSVWGIHDDLMNKLETAKDNTGTERFVKKELTLFKQSIDGVMNTATDNHFQTFLDNYAAKSQQINAGNLLREFRDKFTNSKGEIMANRFHNWAVDLAENRGNKGLDPAMDIPDETMQGIIRIDKDLKRAGLIDLGKARGSPTNLFGALAKGMSIGAAHLGMAATAPGLGNLILHQVASAGEGAINRLRLNSMVKKHLAPPPGGYRNRLLD